VANKLIDLVNISYHVVGFDFPSVIFFQNPGYFGGSNDLAGLGQPYLHGDGAPPSVNDDEGPFRFSYGRYLKISAAVNEVPLVTAPGDQTTFWERTNITIAVAFKLPTLPSGGAFSTLVSKRSATAADNVHSYRLRVNNAGGLVWHAGNGNETVMVASAVQAGKLGIAYFTKAGAAAGAVGVKMQGGSWATGVGSPATAFTYNATFPFRVGAQETTSGPLDTHLEGFLAAITMWKVAVTPATLQAGLEDHFGIANPAAGGSGVSRARVVNA